MIAVGVDLERSRQAVAFAEQHPEVWAGAGHHPEHHTQPDLVALRELAAHPRVVVIGEIGLDFADQAGPAKEAQIARLHDLFTIAVDLDLPVSIHNRDASEALAEAIALYPRLRGVMHYFALEWDWAERFVELGFHLSFAGLITRPSRHALRDVVKRCPKERLLLETDSPFGNAHKRMGVQNRPAYLIDTAELVAELRGISLQELADLELSNASRLFTRMS